MGTIIVLMQVREVEAEQDKTPKRCNAFRAGEGRDKSLKTNCGFFLSFLVLPQGDVIHIAAKDSYEIRMRGGNFRDNCENTMHRRLRKKKRTSIMRMKRMRSAQQ